MQGRIKKMTSRGFGFIDTAEEIDFFFHYKDYDGDWKMLLTKYAIGTIITVSFEVDTESDKGPKARDVKVISSLPPVI